MNNFVIRDVIVSCLKNRMSIDEIADVVEKLRPYPRKWNVRWIKFLEKAYDTKFRHSMRNCECWKRVKKQKYFSKNVTGNHPHEKYVNSCELCFKEYVDKETTAIICPHCESNFMFKKPSKDGTCPFCEKNILSRNFMMYG